MKNIHMNYYKNDEIPNQTIAYETAYKKQVKRIHICWITEQYKKKADSSELERFCTHVDIYSRYCLSYSITIARFQMARRLDGGK